MDVLSGFIGRAVSLGRLSGFKVGEGSQKEIVSHLLFADDTLIFWKSDSGELACLRDILLCFQAVSGLKINLVKSELIQVWDGKDLRRLAEMLRCKADSIPSTYLGLPLGSPYKFKMVWGTMVERFERGIWVSRVPSKVCFFCWAAVKGAILMINNIRRKKIVVTEWCFMCKCNAETTNHLLLHCQSASKLWS